MQCCAIEKNFGALNRTLQELKLKIFNHKVLRPTSQSYLTGIETDDWIELTAWHETLNRTLQELKLDKVFQANGGASSQSYLTGIETTIE